VSDRDKLARNRRQEGRTFPPGRVGIRSIHVSALLSGLSGLRTSGWQDGRAKGRQDNARVAGALLRLLFPSPIHSIRSLCLDVDLASDACAILILSCMANIDSPAEWPPCCDRIALGILSALSTVHCEKRS